MEVKIIVKLIFLRWTGRKIHLFSRDVYFDINGKTSVFFASSQHTIKMYKSYSYDTFISVSASTVNIEENENLTVRYAAPVIANQPGNLIISAYDPIKEQNILKAREYSMQRDYIADENRKREQNKRNIILDDFYHC